MNQELKQELEWLRETLRVHDFSPMHPSMDGLGLAKFLKQYKRYLAEQPIEVCTGCGRLTTDEMGLNAKGEKYLGCCPDSNYVDVKSRLELADTIINDCKRYGGANLVNGEFDQW